MSNNTTQEKEATRLSVEILHEMGFETKSIANPFFGIYSKDLGRDRGISVHNPGTPNECVFLTEGGKDEEMQIFTFRNFDYDGYTSINELNQIMNLVVGLVFKQPFPEDAIRFAAEELFKFSGLPSERAARLDEIINQLRK